MDLKLKTNFFAGVNCRAAAAKLDRVIYLAAYHRNCYQSEARTGLTRIATIVTYECEITTALASKISGKEALSKSVASLTREPLLPSLINFDGLWICCKALKKF